MNIVHAGDTRLASNVFVRAGCMFVLLYMRPCFRALLPHWLKSLGARFASGAQQELKRASYRLSSTC